MLVLCLLAPLALLALGAVLEPDPRGHGTHEQLGFQPCFPMARWNLPCPGCGVTTALVLAARGRVPDSLRTQPFGLVVLVSAFAAALWGIARHARGADLYAALPGLAWKRLGLTLGTLLVLAWLYKAMAVRGWYG